MKQFLWIACPALLLLAALHHASADGLDAYRPKKAGNSLSCRFDTVCNTSEKPAVQENHQPKPIKKTKRRKPVKRIPHPVR